MPLLKVSEPSVSDPPELLPGSSNRFTQEIDILQKAGVFGLKSGSVEDVFVKKMQVVGLTPDQVLSKLALAVEDEVNPSARMQAIRTALQLYMHPAFASRKIDDAASGHSVTFNINSPGVNIQNVLTAGLKNESKIEEGNK